MHQLFADANGEIGQVLADATTKKRLKAAAAADFGLNCFNIVEVAYGRFQLFHHRVCLHHAGAGRQRDRHIDCRLANAGDKALRQLAKQEQAAREDERGHQHRDKAVLQSPLQRGRVPALHGRFALVGDVFFADEQVGQRRYHRDRHDEAGGQRVGNREAKGQEERADDAANQAQRHKHRHRGGRGREDGDSHFLGALQHRMFGIITLLDVAVGVFQHHNRVIHHTANGHGQTAQGHDVERDLGGEELRDEAQHAVVGGLHQILQPLTNGGRHPGHQQQGGEDGERDRNGRYQRCLPAHLILIANTAAQEDQDDDDGKHATQCTFAGHTRDGILNKGGLFKHHVDRCARIGRRELVKQRKHIFGHVDRVGAATLVDAD